MGLVKFSIALKNVFKESYRVLKKDGLMVFSFHHSKAKGWTSIYKAISEAGFTLVAAHPIKAEMSVATPKTATKNPINIDALLVCKKWKMNTIFRFRQILNDEDHNELHKPI